MAAMTGLVGIGDMIKSRPDYREGRPYIAGTGVSVGRVGVLLNAGLTAEERVEEMQGLGLAQVHAALAYYLANREKIDADLQSQDDDYVRAAKTQKAARARGDRSLG